MKVYYPGSLEAKRILRLSLLMLLSIVSASCSADTESVKKAIELHLKDIGVRDVKVDFFMEDPNNKSRAYTSATVTYNFAKADGQLQKEYLGYILNREGQDWKVEKTTPYAKEEQKAMQVLAGEKPTRRPDGP